MAYPDLTRSLEPATLGLVGLTPLLAACNTLLSGLSMGLAYLAVLFLTRVTLSCGGRVLRARSNLIYVLLIAAAWVSIIDLLMQAWCYPLREQLGIYLLLLAMNTTLLVHLEAPALQGHSGGNAPSFPGTTVTGFALLTVTGLSRELVARGGVLTDSRLPAHLEWLDFVQPAYLFKGGLYLAGTSAGAFIMFGLLLSVLSYWSPRAGRAAAGG